jgi:hypothetical protein
MVARTYILAFISIPLSALASPQLLQQDGANPYDDAAAIWLPGMTQGSLDQSGSADPTNATTMPTIVADGWSHDGVNDILDFGYAAALEPKTNPFAMSIWFRATNYPALMGLMGKTIAAGAERWSMCLNSGAKVSCTVQAGASIGSSTFTGLTSNAWHHACLTTISNPPSNWAFAFWVDGTLVTNFALANAESIDYGGGVTAPYRIGCYNNWVGNPDYFMNGKLDLAAHWNRGLSSNEVRQVYELGRRGLRPVWNVMGCYGSSSYAVVFDKLDDGTKSKVSLYSDAALTNLLAETNVTGNAATFTSAGADMSQAVAVVRPYIAGSDDRPVVASNNLTNNLTAWWWPSLDGDYSDRVGNWDGTSGGSVAVSTNGWSFDGTSNSFVEVSTNSAFAIIDNGIKKPVSLTMWARIEGDMGVAHPLFSKCRTVDDELAGEEYLAYKGDGSWYVATNQVTSVIRGLVGGGDGNVIGGAVAPGTWFHVAMTYDTTNLIGYFNGVQYAMDDKIGNPTNSFYPLRFGSLRKSRRLVGSIDNVRFYSVAIPSR